ncbi:Uncharacterised protein [Chlamydia trachomatis]|nr:Uncharacterised protein [Chlamydia trachomatis]
MLKSTVVASILNPHCIKLYIFYYFVAKSVRQSFAVLSNFPTVEVVALARWNLYIILFVNNTVASELFFLNYILDSIAVFVSSRHMVVKRYSVLNIGWLTPRSVKLNAINWHCNIFVFAIYKLSASLIKSPAFKHVVFW